MTAGNQPTPATINNIVSGLALSLRNNFQNIVNVNSWLLSVGAGNPVAVLEAAPFSFSAPDAAVIVSALGNMADLAAKYQGGSGGTALPFNYMANTEPLWGAL
jgi:hypothetical protein